MKQTHKRHRTIARIKKKFKNLGGMVAAATVLSGMMLPGMPAATAHAAVNPNPITPPTAVSQHVSNPSQSTNSPGQADLNSNNPTVTLSHHTEKANQKDNNSTTANSQKTEKTTPAQHHSKNTKSTDKAPTNYKKVLDITATAYAPGAHDNDQYGDKTFMGTTVRPGIIAVDPSVIPLGSRVYIQYPDGHGEYAVAEDTGGAIKGNRIDIAKSTVHNAQDFGMKDVKVFVMDKVKT
jgi:3D (Asp-Asp-Asp) domain-containing protein